MSLIMELKNMELNSKDNTGKELLFYGELYKDKHDMFLYEILQ